MLRRLRPFLFVTFILLFILIPTMRAQAADDDADRAADALKEVVKTLDTMGTFADIEASFPPDFSTFNPSTELELSGIFSQSLGTSLNNTPPSTIQALATAIDDADITTTDGTTISYDNVVVGLNGTAIDIRFDIAITKNTTLPLSVILPQSDPEIRDQIIQGGEIPISLTLNSTIVASHETTEPVLADAFTFISEPIFTLALNTSGDYAPFKSIFGITELTVSGHSDLHLTRQIAFLDPDGANLTLYEIQTTALEDLLEVTAADFPNADDIDLLLNLDTTLANITASISWVD
ncbi:MAG: hypothetical protein KDE51_20570, partial [Anaerolineales bacterium]|nr:hypothetical protein [Anaerolineales bacterium]